MFMAWKTNELKVNDPGRHKLEGAFKVFFFKVQSLAVGEACEAMFLT